MRDAGNPRGLGGGWSRADTLRNARHLAPGTGTSPGSSGPKGSGRNVFTRSNEGNTPLLFLTSLMELFGPLCAGTIFGKSKITRIFFKILLRLLSRSVYIYIYIKQTLLKYRNNL